MRIKRTKQEDLFHLLSGNSIHEVVAKKKKLSVEAPLDYGEFVVWFMTKNKSRINKLAYKRCISNRYTVEDVCSYIQQSILQTLIRRKAVGRPITEPKLYFSKLINFYCVEHQRMHGYIYSLPKRPRAPEAEKEINKHGFNYLEPTTDIGYIDSTVDDDTRADFSHYDLKGVETDSSSLAWKSLMEIVKEEDKAVLTCVHMMNMSVPEASRHLGIAISTAYTRANRGTAAISGSVALHVNLDQPNWKVMVQIEEVNLTGHL